MYPNPPAPGTIFVMHSPPFLTTEPWFTHHPMCPDLPLCAGEPLNKGDMCWINEDGTVWRTDPRKPVIDGIVMTPYAPDEAVRLYREIKGEVRGGYVLDDLEYRYGPGGWGAYLREP